MNRNFHSIIAGTLLVILCAGPLVASNEPVKGALITEPTDQTSVQLDPRIDSWCQGELTSVDLQQQKFSIKGVNMFFATAHAAMQKEITASTQDIADTAQRLAKEEEIRVAWKERLEKASMDDPGQDKEFQFSVPPGITLMVATDQRVAGLEFLNRDRRLAARGEPGAAPKPKQEKLLGAPVVGATSPEDSKPIEGAKPQEPAKPVEGAKPLEAAKPLDRTQPLEAAKPLDTVPGGPEQARSSQEGNQTGELKLADCKVGDQVKVGFHSGYFGNDGYALIKVGVGTPVAAPAEAPAVTPGAPVENAPDKESRPAAENKEAVK